MQRNAGNARVLNAIGDDVAVWQPSRSHRSIITTDALVEGVHFRRETMPLYDAGYRAMASNLSDCAAAGAKPVLATVALVLPQGCTQEGAIEMYEGVLACAAPYRCAIAGGDLTRGPGYAISITVVGEVRAAHIKGRSGARPGDVVALTGALGASRAGLHAADNPNMLSGELLEQAVAAHRRPAPRVAQGRWLAASAHVHAMMDLSDGLATDLARMCERSSCAAVVDDVPVAPSARAAAAGRGEDARAYALSGGEDFELLAAVSPRAFTHLSARFRKRFGTPLLAAGRFTAGTGVAVRNGESEEPLAAAGWDHFS